MPDEDGKILRCNPGENSLKILFMIYEDLECLLEKIDTCQSHPKKSTEKKVEHTHQVTHGLHVAHLIN